METKETSDIGLFSAFLACGATYVDADRSDPKHIIFKVCMKDVVPVVKTYDNLDFSGVRIPVEISNAALTLQDIEAMWINETLHVNAVIYFNALRRAKSIVHSK